LRSELLDLLIGEAKARELCQVPHVLAADRFSEVLR
jgi:hypothetical protein